MTLNGEMARILRYFTEFGSHVKLCLWSWSRHFLILVLVFVLPCMVLFKNVLSCIMLLVTKLHKNLSHHESTICDSFRGALHKSGCQTNKYEQFTIASLCLVVNVCRETARRHRYKYSITARWKFCRRFINSKLNAQYLPSYRLIC